MADRQWQTLGGDYVNAEDNGIEWQTLGGDYFNEEEAVVTDVVGSGLTTGLKLSRVRLVA